jgi:FkbM family methyltransferase
MILKPEGCPMNVVKAVAKKVFPKRVVNAIKAGISPQNDPSQAGETALLKTLVSKYEVSDWIIDVGANDGVSLSNSLPFINRGWHAILIEPAPAVFNKLIANHGRRSNVTCLQVACSDKPGEAELYFGSDGEEGFMSTLSSSENEWFSTARSSASVKVRTETITNILRQCSAPNQPGILSVDCEGMDYEALLGLDIQQFRPTIIVTEEYEWEPQKHAAKYALLINANYSLVQKIGCNTLWIDRSAKERAQSN